MKNLVEIMLAIILICAGIGVSAQNFVPLSVVPNIQHAPTVDGKIQPEEWSNAALLTDMCLHASTMPAQEQTLYYIAFDKENLYVAFHCVHSSDKYAMNSTSDGLMWYDDNAELFIQPDVNKQVKFHFGGNPKGVIMDVHPTLGLAWNGRWKYKTRIEKGYWEGELSVPLADVGLQDIYDGRTIGFLAGRESVYPAMVITTWTNVGQSFHNTALYGRLVFSASKPMARLISCRSGSKFGFAGKIISSSSTPGKLQGKLRLLKDGKTLAEESISLELSSGTTDFKHTVDVGSYGNYEMQLTIADQAGNPVFAKTVYIDYKSVIKLRRLFFHNRVECNISAKDTGISDPKEATFTLKSGNSAIDRRKGVIKNGVATCAFNISKALPGSYIIDSEITSKDGDVSRDHIDLEMPQTPEWFNSRLGITDALPKPWTPMKASGNKVSCWGRDYTFGALPVPADIINQKTQMLAAPISLNAVIDGKHVQWSNGEMSVTRKSEGRIDLSTTARSSAAVLSGKAQIEYDGFVRVDIELKSIKSKRLDGLTLDIPLKREVSTLMAGTNMFPPKYMEALGGEQKLYWNGACDGFIPKNIIEGPFKPYLWLGNDKQGLIWFAESPENWSNKDENKAIQIIPGKGRTTLRIKFVDKSISLNKPFKVTFGFMATPVKRMETRRRLNCSGFYGCEVQNMVRSDTLAYPATGIVDPKHGSLSIRLKPDFDPKTENVHRSLLNLTMPNGDALSLIWAFDNPGLRLLVIKAAKDGVAASYPVNLNSVVTDWTKGQERILTVSWGSEMALYLDGTKLMSSPYEGCIPDLTASLADTKIVFGGGVTITAIKSSTAPFAGGTAASISSDDKTLMLKDFSISPVILKAEKYSYLDQWKEQGVEIVQIHEWWTESQGYPTTVKRRDALKALVDACHKRGIKLIVYLGFQIGDNSPEYKLYQDEIILEPRENIGLYPLADHNGVAISYADQLQNFMIFEMDKLIREVGVDGFYLDGSHIAPGDTNQAHGAGYIDRDGNLKPSYQTFEYRKWMKRMRAIGDAVNPDFWIDLHNCGPLRMETGSVGNSIWSGEGISTIAQNNDYRYEPALTSDAFRSQIIGTQFGIPVDFLDFANIEHALAICSVHGVPVRPFHPPLPKDPVLAVWDKFGFWDAKWYPYFENEKYVTVSAPNVKVSFCQRKDGAILLMATNFGNKPVLVSINFKNIKIPAGAAVRDELKCALLDVKPGKLTVELLPWRANLLSISRDKN